MILPGRSSTIDVNPTLDDAGVLKVILTHEDTAESGEEEWEE